jgi:AcrR family transcriptional regulator
LAVRSGVKEARERIIRAAIALFSRQGYHGTCTRDIARLANVSEVTVYRYFSHKEDIFWAAVTSLLGNFQQRLDALYTTWARQAPEVVLPKIFTLLVELAAFSPDTVRLIVVAYLEHRVKAIDICRVHLAPLFSAISGYLQLNIGAGTVRNLNTLIATAAMALPVFVWRDFSDLADENSMSHLNDCQAIDVFAQFWLDVLDPSPSKQTQHATQNLKSRPDRATLQTQ